MKLTESRWGYKGKYRNHKVEIVMSAKNNYKWKYRISKDDKHVFDSEWQGKDLFFDSKEDARDAAIVKINEIINMQ